MNYFGTDGIRRPAEEFTPDFLAAIIKGLVDYTNDNVKILIGGDTRESTEWILRDLEIALETFGIEYSNVGVLPTPAINYCFFQMGFDFAIDVTASHNPYTDNGIKIFERGDRQGIKLSPKGCKCIEKSLDNPQSYTPISPSLREDLHDEALSLYLEHLRDYVGICTLDNLHLGLDCANGATSVIGKTIFEQLGAKVNLINGDKSYNTKINKNCGSTHLHSIQRLVTDKHLNFGVAFDGDGDRCMLINEIGEEIDGDFLLAILADYLKLDTIAATVMVNQGFLKWAKKKGINIEITPVGDSNVKAAMDEKHIALGGEQSGHIILPGEPTGDGILTALMVAKILSESKKSLGELTSSITKFPQITINMHASPAQKKALQNKPAQELIDDYNGKLKTVQGRLLVRPSGTEPLIRITIWGNDETAIETIANKLKNELEVLL